MNCMVAGTLSVGALVNIMGCWPSWCKDGNSLSKLKFYLSEPEQDPQCISICMSGSMYSSLEFVPNLVVVMLTMCTASVGIHELWNS